MLVSKTDPLSDMDGIFRKPIALTLDNVFDEIVNFGRSIRYLHT
jgi:hypothetical protein